MTNGQRYDRSNYGFLERLFVLAHECIHKFQKTGDRKYLRKAKLIDDWLKEDERGWHEEYR